ncbi:GlsB/YeaQ/YmgE family stress response membrane protein [Lacticaseibacillus pabuli]|uniref:GlsB/YeaQ/YmgE family stress response membrane protein n=1 Tax=Lacticaseibacillus pabuli TaxID=3025672 RepID=A0ABY7WUG8_9LACO|nr:GlsB/YeaQ/YmgE family stress response membrane protein [Lacticaseibacillus sp. KACC 23028]WDF82641.1 GlsB/YeaQ/YmgE family stress response membrane protein [Lacticaseibacillus sp. KACC 23028]
MLHFLAIIIVGAIIGSIGGAFVGRGSLGCGGNIVAGLVGSWIGSLLLGSWGPHLAGMAIFPAIIGAMIFVFIASLIMGNDRRR